MKTADGSEILTLDPATLTYRTRQSPRLPALDAARAIEDVAERMKTLFLGNDNVGAFLRATLGSLLLYAARVAPEIAYSIDDVDRAMRWGFGWDMGPFEIWDAIGVREVLAATGNAEPPPMVAELLRSGRNRFREGPLPPTGPGRLLLATARKTGGVVKTNPGASLVDLGDGVLAVEFHSKMNTVGGDTLEMLHAGVREATSNFVALVIGNDAPNFSAGANLMLLLLEAQEGNWDDIDLMVRTFQAATQALRYADVPVVVCPAGLTLGGGCEIALHGDRIQAAAEGYIGLVEAGVGLIPAGGGAKEMLARSVEGLADPRADLLPRVQKVFETIGFARVSTSAADAARLGFLREVDAITMNRERLMADAKAVALERVREGYRPAGTAHRDPGRRRRGARAAEARRSPGLARRPHQRSRRRCRADAGQHPRGRSAAASDDRVRTVPAGSRTRGVPQAVRREEDPRANPAHAQDGQAVEKLTVTNTPRTRSVFEQGNGPALVLLPGIQGRWEYTRPTRRSARQTFPRPHVLARRIAARRPRHLQRPRSIGWHACWTTAESSARFCAACRTEGSSRPVLRRRTWNEPARSSWRRRRDPDGICGHATCSTRAGHGSSARCFSLETPFRLRAELNAALPEPIDRLEVHALAGAHDPVGAGVAVADGGPRTGARRFHGIVSDCARIKAPTLIVTGERALDRVVPVDGTSSYTALIPGARHVVMERTGHPGTITRPAEFAAMVRAFVDETSAASGFSRTSRTEVA